MQTAKKIRNVEATVLGKTLKKNRFKTQHVKNTSTSINQDERPILKQLYKRYYQNQLEILINNPDLYLCKSSINVFYLCKGRA
jgi:hypothetical protein